MIERLKIVNLGVATLKNITFSLQSGQCAGLAGASGTGKSLFLRALADLDPHEGEVWLDGVALDRMPAPLWRRQVGFLPAESAWWYDDVGAHFETPPVQLLRAVGFDPEVMGWQISRLSSGERQRLALVRLLALQPKVLLLDEPTANLDRDNTRRVESLLSNIVQSQKVTIVWVSHDQEQLLRNCSPIFEVSGHQIRLTRPGQFNSGEVAL